MGIYLGHHPHVSLQVGVAGVQSSYVSTVVPSHPNRMKQSFHRWSVISRRTCDRIIREMVCNLNRFFVSHGPGVK